MGKKWTMHNGRLDLISKLPLLELLGESRVLIENHLGVVGYSAEEIKIKVHFGIWVVSGDHLQLMQINRSQIVIKGEIYSVIVQGR